MTTSCTLQKILTSPSCSKVLQQRVLYIYFQNSTLLTRRKPMRNLQIQGFTLFIMDFISRVRQSPNSKCSDYSPCSEIFKTFSVRTIRCSCCSLEMSCSASRTANRYCWVFGGPCLYHHFSKSLVEGKSF